MNFSSYSLTLESRKKIEDALIALDYNPNKVARSLANGKSEMIGIIIPDLFLHYYSQMLNCLINTYSKYLDMSFKNLDKKKKVDFLIDKLNKCSIEKLESIISLIENEFK